MTRKFRLILFLSCLLIFALAAPIFVLYSQGYRFDFQKKSLVRTGGIFLKASPRQSNVYLDGKPAKKTDFFFGSILIENLLPKEYKIRVEKEGYFPWEKTLQVKEKEVTEAKFISLIPSIKNDFEILTQNVQKFWPSPNGKKLMLLEKEGAWSLKLYDIEKNLKSLVLNERDISSKGAEFLNLEWLADAEINLNIAIQEQEKNYSLKLDRAVPVISEIEVPAIPSNILSLKKINKDEIYYLDKSGFVFKNDPNSKINSVPFPLKPETEYQLEIFDNFVFLKEAGNLYLIRDSFEKILDNVDRIIMSPNKKNLAISANSEIWIFFLKDSSENPIRKAGEKIFLLRFSQKIENLFWFNNAYLIFNIGFNIKIAEIDNRDRINIADLTQFPDPEMFWDRTNKKLYILSQNKLFLSEKIIND